MSLYNDSLSKFLRDTHGLDSSCVSVTCGRGVPRAKSHDHGPSPHENANPFKALISRLASDRSRACNVDRMKKSSVNMPGPPRSSRSSRKNARTPARNRDNRASKPCSTPPTLPAKTAQPPDRTTRFRKGVSGNAHRAAPRALTSVLLVKRRLQRVCRRGGL